MCFPLCNLTPCLCRHKMSLVLCMSDETHQLSLYMQTSDPDLRQSGKRCSFYSPVGTSVKIVKLYVVNQQLMKSMLKKQNIIMTILTLQNISLAVSQHRMRARQTYTYSTYIHVQVIDHALSYFVAVVIRTSLLVASQILIRVRANLYSHFLCN